MTKAQAINAFMNSFGIQAFPNTYVPEEKVFPWITYENNIGNTGDSININVSLWMHTESESIPNAKVEQIAQAIGRGGTQISYDDGTIWIRRGSPWCNSIVEDDSSIKHKSMNMWLEFN